jgi:hypothetical protein
MTHNPILELPLNAVIRSEIALPLQQILSIHTVGSLLAAWRVPQNQKHIEQIFDSPQQARHAVAVCATWLGVQMKAQTMPALGWWRADDATGIGA